ncbi:hypothetical protein HBB16_21315 [Pseudonocardia sp. MCCB 268]|nr:hypothetical protein [Pseudonocardia cytotoxica]
MRDARPDRRLADPRAGGAVSAAGRRPRRGTSGNRVPVPDGVADRLDDDGRLRDPVADGGAVDSVWSSV